jgi:hypothetical protein
MFPKTAIDVVLFSHSTFEPAIRHHTNMTLRSFGDKPAGASASKVPPHMKLTGSSPTLKTLRFPELPALSGWQRPSDALTDAVADDRRECEIFDASVRARNQFRRTDNFMPGLKMVEFFVELPDAKTVRLAADFTGWEEASLEMIRFEGGIWSLAVPLPPGIYAYRFLVDGEWYHDLRTLRRSPDSPGPTKAFVEVG